MKLAVRSDAAHPFASLAGFIFGCDETSQLNHPFFKYFACLSAKRILSSTCHKDACRDGKRGGAKAKGGYKPRRPWRRSWSTARFGCSALPVLPLQCPPPRTGSEDVAGDGQPRHVMRAARIPANHPVGLMNCVGDAVRFLPNLALVLRFAVPHLDLLDPEGATRVAAGYPRSYITLVPSSLSKHHDSCAQWPLLTPSMRVTRRCSPTAKSQTGQIKGQARFERPVRNESRRSEGWPGA